MDDEELLCMTGTELLEIQGYRMKSVMDSDDALKLFKANPQDFDLLITDQTMPKMAGSELIEKLLNIR